MDHPQGMNVWRHCIAYQQNEEKRRHYNANCKPTRENNTKQHSFTPEVEIGLRVSILIFAVNIP